MPLRLKVDPGGEKWLPFAKKKLRDLKAQMRRLGLKFRTQWLQVSDVERIFLRTQWVEGGVWLDVILISAGGEFDFYYIQPPIVLGGDETVQQEIDLINAILSDPDQLAALAFLAGVSVEEMTAMLTAMLIDLEGQLGGGGEGGESVATTMAIYTLSQDSPKMYPVNFPVSASTGLTRFIRAGGDPKKQAILAMSTGEDGDGNAVYTILDRKGQRGFAATIPSGYTLTRDPQISGDRIGAVMIKASAPDSEAALITDGESFRFLGIASMENSRMAATGSDFFILYTTSDDMSGTFSKVVSLARGDIFTSPDDVPMTEIAANEHDVCFLQWENYDTIRVYIDEQEVYSAPSIGDHRVKAFKDGFVVLFTNSPFDTGTVVSNSDPLKIVMVTLSRDADDGSYSAGVTEHYPDINHLSFAALGGVFEVSDKGVGHFYWKLYDEGLEEISYVNIYKSDGTVVPVHQGNSANRHYSPILFSVSLKDTCAFLVQGEQDAFSFHQFPELKIIKGDGTEATFTSDTYFTPAFEDTTADVTGVGNNNDFYIGVLVSGNTTNPMFGSYETAYFAVTDSAGRFLIASDGSKTRTDDPSFAQGDISQVAYLTRSDAVYALGVGAASGFHVDDGGEVRTSYKHSGRFWVPIPGNLTRIKDFEYWSSLEEQVQ